MNKDTYLDEAAPSKNHGIENILKVEKNGKVMPEFY